jgi:hypothetical protein
MNDVASRDGSTRAAFQNDPLGAGSRGTEAGICTAAKRACAANGDGNVMLLMAAYAGIAPIASSLRDRAMVEA